MLWTDPRKDLARAECRRWAGTRHANKIAVPRQGVDCVRFVFEVVTAAGVCPRFTLPAYDERLGVLRETNVMEGIITDHFFADRVPDGDPPEFGDLAIFQCGDQSNHIGIVMDGSEVWHVPGKSRVGPEAWGDVRRRLQSLVRLTAEGFKVDPATLTWAAIQARTT